MSWFVETAQHKGITRAQLTETCEAGACREYYGVDCNRPGGGTNATA